MEEVLNLGVNFSVTPEKLDFTQVLVDHRYFERNMLWKEFWHSNEENDNDVEHKPSIFKKKKWNFPKNHSTPAALKVFISSTKSELSDPKNRNNNIKSNLTKPQQEALKKLDELQKN